MDFIELLKVIILGIIEGITEWLPVSSSGHILLFDSLWGLDQSDAFKEIFLYFVQAGAIMAVIVLFFAKLCPFKLTAKSDANGAPLKRKLYSDKKTWLLWAKIAVACIPAAVVGILFDMPDKPAVISVTLILYGIAFILVEKRNENKSFPIQSTNELTYKHAVIIGFFQTLALIPGTSRSGATIIGALLIGISRPAGAEFTFFLAIPVMLGASAIKILKFILSSGGFTGAELGYLFIGTLVAFAVSLFVIKFLMNFVRKHDFKVFGYYRIALGLLIVLLLILL